MAYLSEQKGVMMWLENKGNDEQFSGFLVKKFNKQTGLSFGRLAYTTSAESNSKFKNFTSWYQKQNISQLEVEFQEYQIEKQKQKDLSLERYYNSDIHKLFMENKDKSLKEIYKGLKDRIPYGELKSFYKKSKAHINF